MGTVGWNGQRAESWVPCPRKRGHGSYFSGYLAELPVTTLDPVIVVQGVPPRGPPHWTKTHPLAADTVLDGRGCCAETAHQSRSGSPLLPCPRKRGHATQFSSRWQCDPPETPGPVLPHVQRAR